MPNIIPGNGSHLDIPLYNLAYIVVEREYGRAAVQNRHLEQFDFMYSEPVRFQFIGDTMTEDGLKCYAASGGPGVRGGSVHTWIHPYRGKLKRVQLRGRFGQVVILNLTRVEIDFDAYCTISGASAYTTYTKTYTSDQLSELADGGALTMSPTAFPDDWSSGCTGDGTEDIWMRIYIKIYCSVGGGGTMYIEGPALYGTREEFTRTY